MIDFEDLKAERLRRIIAIVAVLVTIYYLYWRVTETLNLFVHDLRGHGLAGRTCGFSIGVDTGVSRRSFVLGGVVRDLHPRTTISTVDNPLK